MEGRGRGTRLSPAVRHGIGESYQVGSARGDLTWSMPTQRWAGAIELVALLILLVVAGPQAAQRNRIAAPADPCRVSHAVVRRSHERSSPSRPRG